MFGKRKELETFYVVLLLLILFDVSLKFQADRNSIYASNKSSFYYKLIPISFMALYSPKKKNNTEIKRERGKIRKQAHSVSVGNRQQITVVKQKEGPETKCNTSKQIRTQHTEAHNGINLTQCVR